MKLSVWHLNSSFIKKFLLKTFSMYPWIQRNLTSQSILTYHGHRLLKQRAGSRKCNLSQKQKLIFYPSKCTFLRICHDSSTVKLPYSVLWYLHTGTPHKSDANNKHTARMPVSATRHFRQNDIFIVYETIRLSLRF